MTNPESGPGNQWDQHRQIGIELLEFGMNALLTDRPFTPGLQIAELVLIGLHFKIMAGLEAVITLAERGLPTFAIMREMVEALISIAYIAAEDSVERASLYRDFLAVSRWKGARARASHAELKGMVSDQQLKMSEAARNGVVSRRGEKIVKDMMDPKKWRTWTGKLSVREMANAGDLSDATYLLGYAWPSQIIHGLDADSYFETSAEGVVRPTRPNHPKRSFLPGASVALAAIEVIDKFLGLGKRSDILRLKGRIDTMLQAQGAKASS